MNLINMANAKGNNIATKLINRSAPASTSIAEREVLVDINRLNQSLTALRSSGKRIVGTSVGSGLNPSGKVKIWFISKSLVGL